MDFEKYLADFQSTIDITDLLVNFVVVTILALIIQQYYVRFGRAISNRQKFSNNFIPLALATLLIITVIKSSIALSLGLVGALSIVRFRAAIKDPEELTYLFLVIGLGLIGGANKPLLAILSFAIILPVLYLHQRFFSKPVSSQTHRNLSTLWVQMKPHSVDELSKHVSQYFDHLELKRVDETQDQMSLHYACKISSTAQWDNVKDYLKTIDSQVRISMVEKPDVVA